MNKELDELIRLAKKFPETDKAELCLFVHLEALCDEKFKTLEIIKSFCKFDIYEYKGEYFMWIILSSTSNAMFRLKNKEEYDLLKKVLGNEDNSN